MNPGILIAFAADRRQEMLETAQRERLVKQALRLARKARRQGSHG